MTRGVVTPSILLLTVLLPAILLLPCAPLHAGLSDGETAATVARFQDSYGEPSPGSAKASAWRTLWNEPLVLMVCGGGALLLGALAIRVLRRRGRTGDSSGGGGGGDSQPVSAAEGSPTPPARGVRSHRWTFLLHWLLWLLLGAMSGRGLTPALQDDDPTAEHKTLPAEWRMPAHRGMVGLRLAMIHDVLCGRWSDHGPAFHRARVDRLLARLPAEPARLDQEQLALVDDLGVSLMHLGRGAEAVAWFRRKAADRVVVGPPTEPPIPGRGALTSARTEDPGGDANLGTALLRVHLPAALAGDRAARQQVDAGLAMLRLAAARDPAAAFGRETWEVALADHLLAATRDPTLLRRFDASGAPLIPPADPDRPPSPRLSHQVIYVWAGVLGRRNDVFKRSVDMRFTPDLTAAQVDRTVEPNLRGYIRDFLVKTGADPAWLAAVAAANPAAQPRVAVPWDEPVLGALGCWMLDDGPSPHLALLLANTCERIGQRQLALEAWQRTADLADGFSSDPTTVAWLRALAEERMARLADGLGLGLSGLQRWRAAFAEELARTDRWRAEHHAREAVLLASGVDPGDPRIATARGPSLATMPGSEDELWIALFADVGRYQARGHRALAPLLLLWIGVSAWLAVASWWLLATWRARRARRAAHAP